MSSLALERGGLSGMTEEPAGRELAGRGPAGRILFKKFQGICRRVQYLTKQGW